MEEIISVPKWVLESIEDIFCIKYNIYDGKNRYLPK